MAKKRNARPGTEVLEKVREKIVSGFYKWAEEEMGSPFYFNDKIIFHYTNVTGLKGIIENNCLWATNLSYVNDSKELSLGLSIYREACQLLLKRKRNSKLYRTIVEQFYNCLNSKNISNRYACCFTDNGDLLSQWRGYGSNGQGYAIGFETKKLVGNLEPYAEPSRIIYDLTTQRNYAEKHVDALIRGFTESLKKAHISVGKHVDEIVRYLEQESEYTILGFKHRGFEEESENRLHLNYSDFQEIKVIEKNGILIPYIELKTKQEKKLPIKQITIGPTIDYDRAEKGVKFLLERHGYTGVKIVRSQIPFKL